MEQHKQNKVPSVQYPPQGGPPSYGQVGYPAQQGAYSSPQVGYVAQGAYPNATATVIPIANMEKNPVNAVCSGCNNQVMTSVNGALNNNGIAWIVYSVCCGGLLYLLFLLIIEAFKTFTHKCPMCGKILASFTPKIGGGEKAALICAVSFHVIIVVIIVGIYVAAYVAASSVQAYTYNDSW